MPNFKLGSKLPNEIQQRCASLTSRTVRHMQADFPLTADEIETAVCEPDVLERLRFLKQRKIRGLPWHNRYVILLTPQGAPGLDRSAAINVDMCKQIFVPDTGFDAYYFLTKTFDDTVTLTQTFIPPHDKAAALSKWATRALREHRRKELADKTVISVFSALHSTAHIMANWPFLATLVEDNTWRAKLRNHPNKLDPWTWSDTMRSFWAKRIDATEIILNKALMLDDYNPDPTAPEASIVAWERLEKDPKW